jgi:hypothetical protein
VLAEQQEEKLDEVEEAVAKAYEPRAQRLVHT